MENPAALLRRAVVIHPSLRGVDDPYEWLRAHSGTVRESFSKTPGFSPVGGDVNYQRAPSASNPSASPFLPFFFPLSVDCFLSNGCYPLIFH